jgi:hypothetical protein
MLDRIAGERPDWSVICYSGYTLAALRRRGPDAAALLARTDVLVAGAYRAERRPSHPLAGSGNQRLHFLTDRGMDLREAIDALPRNRANLGLAADGGDPWLIGVMDTATRTSIAATLGHESRKDGELT